MDSVHSQTVNLIWNIAEDVLRDVFVRGQYCDVILSMVGLRRLDALLESSKEAAERMFMDILQGRFYNKGIQIFHVTGYFSKMSHSAMTSPILYVQP